METGFTIYFNNEPILVYEGVSVLPSRWLRKIARKLKLRVTVFPNQAWFYGNKDSNAVDVLRLVFI